MDPRGVVAFIITLHEVAALLGVTVGLLIAVLGFALLRAVPAGRRTLIVLAFSLGCAAAAFALTAKLFHVRPLDVDVVRVE